MPPTSNTMWWVSWMSLGCFPVCKSSVFYHSLHLGTHLWSLTALEAGSMDPNLVPGVKWENSALNCLHWKAALQKREAEQLQLFESWISSHCWILQVVWIYIDLLYYITHISLQWKYSEIGSGDATHMVWPALYASWLIQIRLVVWRLNTSCDHMHQIVTAYGTLSLMLLPPPLLRFAPCNNSTHTMCHEHDRLLLVPRKYEER